jgi:hypothetical protein
MCSAQEDKFDQNHFKNCWVPVAHACNPSYLKIIHKKRSGRVAQAVECLPNKCEAQSSNHNATKKKKE